MEKSDVGCWNGAKKKSSNEKVLTQSFLPRFNYFENASNEKCNNEKNPTQLNWYLKQTAVDELAFVLLTQSSILGIPPKIYLDFAKINRR